MLTRFKGRDQGDVTTYLNIVVERDRMRGMFDRFGHLTDWQWRTVYGNLYGLGGEQVEDVKVYPGETPPSGAQWLKPHL